MKPKPKQKRKPGGGRKALPSADLRVTLAVRVKRDTKAEMQRQAREISLSIGKLLDGTFQTSTNYSID